MSDTLPASALPGVAVTAEDPMQTIFDTSEAMLDALEVVTGCLLALRILLDLQAIAPEARMAIDALLASLLFQVEQLRRQARSSLAASIEGARR